MTRDTARRPALPVREADITRAVLDYLYLVHGWSLKVHGHLGQRRGVPDILACVRGHFVGIEVKRRGGRLSPRQIDELAAIIQADGIALVVDDVHQVIAALERLEDRADGG
jgi:hypothetical protein